MPESSETREVLGRAGRRAAFHMVQALIEGLKAVEAVIEEVGNLSQGEERRETAERTRIEIE